MKKHFLILALACVVFMMMGAQGPTGRLHPALEQRLKTLPPGERVAVIVELKEQARAVDIVSGMRGAGRRDRARAVAAALRYTADRYQGPLRARLKEQEALGTAERVVPFWIFNGFAVTAPEALIRELASRPDVREVRLDKPIPVPSLFRTAKAGASSVSEWNIETVRTPEVWSIDPAYNGTGAVIGSFDTGVDRTHPDLAPRYRGNHQISWFDPYQEHAVPYDFHGHGTHTTGIAVGGDASGANIGIAPGAVWIAAKAWDDSGLGLTSAFHEIFEWFLAPGGDPDNAPDVVNCSWGFDEAGCDTEFLADIEAWRAAGIFPAFAAGNDGPDAGSVRSPGAYPAAFTVGATGVSDEIADFSGQGPTPCDGSTKPDISAPGDGVLSAVPWGYEYMSGTSMAAPHITGAVALMRSIDPGLTVDQLESALIAGAKDLGAAGPDNAFGAGRLDLYVSAQIAILGPDFPVVKVLAIDAEATEAGPTPGVFSITRTGNTDSDLDVRFSISGTATMGIDYEPIAGSATIPAGQASFEIPVTAIDDQVAELPETVILTIAPDPAYIVSGTDTANVTIESDELLCDLVVSSLTVPAAAGAGESITIADTTKNQGGGAAEPSMTRFYLSANTAFDGTDILLGGRSVAGLPASGTSSGSTTVTIPEGTVADNWYIIARADGEEALTESSETNNNLAKAIKIGPDLDITALTAPATAGGGEAIGITDTTKNTGGGAAGASRTNYYLSTDSYLDGSDGLLGGRSVPALAVGGSSSGSATVTIPEQTAAGNWYIIAKADGEGAVTEISENNNTSSRTIKIGPDLAVSSLSAPTAAGEGDSIAITDTTKNQGGGAAEASVTRFYLSSNSSFDETDIPLGGRGVVELASGGTSSATTNVVIPPGTAADTWYIIAKADGEGTVAETSETNNTLARSILIGPDLDVTALDAPATAGGGVTIAVTDATKNQGGGAAAASVTRFYLSANSTRDEADILLGSRSVGALAAGETSSGTTNVTIPEGTAVGSFYVIAEADGEGAVTEASETNNTSAKSIKIGPDLDITALGAPSTAGVGQAIAITDTTKNQGGGVAAASRTIFYLSANGTYDGADILLGGRDVAGLAAGGTSSGSTTVTVPQGTSLGSWYIIALADGLGVVTETSETNNTSAKLITIGPDLVVTATTVPATAGVGQTVTLTDTTKNQGGGPADPSMTRFYLSANSSWDETDIPLGGRSVAGLAAGGTSSGSTSVTIPQGTAVGSWYIIAKADGDGVVTEASETNNTLAKSIKIGPDLDITALTAPASGSGGQTVAITDTTKNQGGGTAATSRTYFYLSADTTLDASDILLGSRAIPSLAALGSSSGSTSVVIPQGTAVGNWYIIAKADGEAVVAETSETNNTYSRAFKVI